MSVLVIHAGDAGLLMLRAANPSVASVRIGLTRLGAAGGGACGWMGVS